MPRFLLARRVGFTMATALQLRAILGNKVRYSIELESAIESASLGARWACGCRGVGRSFTALIVQPCAEHGEAVKRLRRN